MKFTIINGNIKREFDCKADFVDYVARDTWALTFDIENDYDEATRYMIMNKEYNKLTIDRVADYIGAKIIKRGK